MNGATPQELLERIAENLVFADSSDLRILAGIYTDLGALTASIAEEDLPRSRAACHLAEEWVNKIILEEAQNPAETLAALSALISPLQEVLDQKRPEAEVVFPALPDAGGSADPAPSSSTAAQLGLDESLVGEFLEEASDHLEIAEKQLLNVETTPDDMEALNAIFRAFHTIKGGAGFLALADLQSLAHEAETLLDQARQGHLSLTGPYVDITFDAIDAMKHLLTALRARTEGGSVPKLQLDLPELMRRIGAFATGIVRVDAPAGPAKRKLGEILLEKHQITQETLSLALAQQAKSPQERLGEVLVATSELPPRVVAHVSARVSKRLRALGLASSEEYLRVLRNDSGQELVQLLDAISTNVTSFFREDNHFTFLRLKLQEWRKSGQARFRCWSCAASTGEEPYSMAITMAEALGWECDFKILATDISTRALACGMQGEYTGEKMKPVPGPLRDTYFTRNGLNWKVTRKLRERVVFRRLNLAEQPFPMHGPLDVVFCRNVMIYFDNTVRSNLLSGIHRLLRPGGCLLVGHTESLTGVSTSFSGIKPSVYMKS